MSTILTDTYKNVLKMAGLAITEDDCVSIVDDKKLKPLTIKGKRLVLPTHLQLNNSDWEHRIVFHPGYELFHRGESIVLERYRNLLLLNLNQVVAANIHRFLSMGTSLTEQETMTPDQQEYLIWVKDAKQETIDRFEKIVASYPASEMNKLFIKVFMKRGATLEGRDFGRAGIVSFPFYEMLVEEKKKKGTKKINGVTVNAADLDSMIHLLEYIFPGINVPDKYSRGTNVQTNPLFDSLMRTALAIAEPLNSLHDLFGEKLGDEVRINVEWAPAVLANDTFYKEILKVPMQSGNEGSVVVSTNDPSPAQPLTHPSVVKAHTAVAAPAAVANPLSGYAALTGHVPAVATPVVQAATLVHPAPVQFAQPAPVVQPAAVYPMYQQQQQLYNQFGQPVNQVAQAPVNVRNPDGSTNFAALIASDPALAHAAGAVVHNPMGHLRGAPNSRATLSNPVAQVNNGWGNSNGWGNTNTQSNGWGNTTFMNNGPQI